MWSRTAPSASPTSLCSNCSAWPRVSEGLFARSDGRTPPISQLVPEPDRAIPLRIWPRRGHEALELSDEMDALVGCCLKRWRNGRRRHLRCCEFEVEEGADRYPQAAPVVAGHIRVDRALLDRRMDRIATRLVPCVDLLLILAVRAASLRVLLATNWVRLTVRIGHPRNVPGRSFRFTGSPFT
jgi:hypothetical protein